MIRHLTRWLVLAAAVALAWPIAGGGSGHAPAVPMPPVPPVVPWTAVLLPALSPFVMLNSAVAMRSAGVLTLIALPPLLLALIIPRGFCRWGCPAGLVQETLGRLLRRRDRKGAPAQAVIQRIPRAGQWLFWLALGGALLGYPWLLWFDPLAIFQASLGLWHRPLVWTSLIAGLGLPVVVLVDLVLPRVWCARLCPLGATQDLLAVPRRLFRTRSSGSVSAGPLEEGDSDEAALAAADSKSGDSTGSMARRGLLAAALGAAGVWLWQSFGGRPATPLRPPGSVPERHFSGLCIRCGNCVQACPSRIIQADLGSTGVANFLTPVLHFDTDYCREDCHRCNEVCPSGAIARLPLEEKRRQVIGQARLNLDDCVMTEGRECRACVVQCSSEAISLGSPDGGFTIAPAVDLTLCIGCGACEVVCPARAIRVVPRGAESDGGKGNIRV